MLNHRELYVSEEDPELPAEGPAPALDAVWNLCYSLLEVMKMLEIESSVLRYVSTHPDCTGTDIMNALKSGEGCPSIQDLQHILYFLLGQNLIRMPLGSSFPDCSVKLTSRGTYALMEFDEQRQEKAAQEAKNDRQRKQDRFFAILSGAIAALIGSACTELVPDIVQHFLHS